MIAFVSPQEEARALRRAAVRAGCTVRELAVRETSVGARAVGRVTCPDGWGAARMLLASAVEDAKSAGARDLALDIRRDAPDDAAFARAVHAYVKQRVAFVREAGEVFTSPAYTLATGGGDCDDHARLVYAIASAGGLPARLAFLHHGGPNAQPTHAVALLGVNGKWSWAETTIDAAFGEHPLAAAERLGLIEARSDLAREVLVMSEKNLPPPPAGYDDANPPELVARDVEALAKLGWPIGSVNFQACEPSFRHAVAEFQRSSAGLTVDGLIGPNTRRRLAQELGTRFPGDTFSMGYLAAVDPQAARIAAARATFDQALLELGIVASREGKEALLAVAWGETRFADPALGWGDSHNWGAVVYNPSRGDPFRSWGSIEHGDRNASGDVVKRLFQRYPSELEGAKDKIRIALRTPAARAAVAQESGAAEALAAAMYDAGYYEGVKGTREDRIAAYAGMMRSGMATLAKTGGPPEGSGVGAAVAVAALLFGVVAASAWVVSS